MPKIDLDKYYTPVDVANHCWEITDEIINISENINRIIEPSCGNGAFL